MKFIKEYFKFVNEGKISAVDVDGKRWSISKEEADQLRKWCEEVCGWDVSDRNDKELLNDLIDDAGDYEDEYENKFVQFRADMKLGDKLKTPIKTKDGVILTSKKDKVYLYDKETNMRKDLMAYKLHYPVINGKTDLAYSSKTPPYVVFSSPEARQKVYPNSISTDSFYNDLIRKNDQGKTKKLITKLNKANTPIGDKISNMLKDRYPDYSTYSPSELQRALDAALDNSDELLAHEISKFMK